MAIPGLKPKYEVRGKVRIGEKGRTASGKEFPKSTDHFVSDDAEFGVLHPGKPRSILVRFPYDTADECFTTGLEWWRGKQLTCYTKGDGTAYRVKTEVRPDDTVTGPEMGRERLPIVCRFRTCPLFGTNADNKACRPMGRLVFFLDGGREDAVLELDTKAWNSIEKLTTALTVAQRSGPLTGRVFELTVEMRQKGTSKFPVLDIQEAKPVPVNTPQDVEKLEAITLIERMVDQGDPTNRTLAAALDLVRPGWRDDERYIDRIREVGPEVALKALLDRLVTEVA